MKRRFVLALSIAALGAVFLPGTQEEATAQSAVTLRIATLAPEGSSWMRVFNAWNNSLRQRTNNTVSLQFYAGGTQGDERDFIRKIRAGQMDGAAVTSTGLGQVVRPVLVLSAPGLIREYRQLDRVRRRFDRQFRGQFEREGYTLLGWGDVGKARLFSRRAINQPSDLRSVRPWAWRDDVIFSEFLRVVGANPVRLGVPEVYPALQTGMVDTVPSSALAAVSLQWHTRLSHVSQQNSGIIIGATILQKARFDSLSPDQQTALMETSEQAHQALRRAIRRDDDRAYATILRRGITEVDQTPHQAAWDDAARQTRERLAGRLYPRSMLDRVAAAVGD
ncbi:MAG: TRAP transporter substrate-binding protein DctP [Myxococcales bacterium]|nr:TRAP transporter substrate-binding protein DctP [Myxococcales bacterium]